MSPRHTSHSAEWFTPPAIIEAARTVLGGIDLDPASCAQANQVVRATCFFDAVDNGFALPWRGRVFLNPPGGVCDADGLRVVRRGGRLVCEATGECGLAPGHTHCGPVQSAAKAWWFRLAAEYAAGRVTAAIFLGFSVEILQTTQVAPPPGLPLPLDFSLCFPRTRLAFVDTSGEPVSGNTHASVVVYLPPTQGSSRTLLFDQTFTPIGRVHR